MKILLLICCIIGNWGYMRYLAKMAVSCFNIELIEGKSQVSINTQPNIAKLLFILINIPIMFALPGIGIFYIINVLFL